MISIVYLYLPDELRQESNDIASKLTQLGLDVNMLTGDQESVARKVSLFS